MARAGLFRDRAVFQRMASTTDDFGNTTGAFASLTTRSAHILERLGKEEVQQGERDDVAVATMRVRSDTVVDGVTVADRVSVRGTIWSIRSIMQVSAKGDLLEMRLEKGVAP